MRLAPSLLWSQEEQGVPLLLILVKGCELDFDQAIQTMILPVQDLILVDQSLDLILFLSSFSLLSFFLFLLVAL